MSWLRQRRKAIVDRDGSVGILDLAMTVDLVDPLSQPISTSSDQLSRSSKVLRSSEKGQEKIGDMMVPKCRKAYISVLSIGTNSLLTEAWLFILI